jgi:hypothetical protein
MRDFGNLFEVCAHRHRATRPRPITLGTVAIVYIVRPNTFFANKFRFAMSVRSPQACGLTPPNTPLRVGPAKRLACVAVDSDEESVCCTQQVNTQPFEDDDDEVEKPTVSLPTTPTTVGTIAPVTEWRRGPGDDRCVACTCTKCVDNEMKAQLYESTKAQRANDTLLLAELRRIAKEAKYKVANSVGADFGVVERVRTIQAKAFADMASLLDGTTEVGQVDN